MNKKNLIISILIIVDLILIGGAYMLGTKMKKTSSTVEPATLVEGVKASAVVEITNEGFKPATLSINKGTLVTFVNKDAGQHSVASDPHPTHTNLSGFDSTNLNNEDTYFFVFNKIGTYNYHDELNPLQFKGTVIVK